MRVLAALAFLLVLVPATFAEDDHPRPFDQNFDAMSVVDAALAEALAGDKRVLLILGANWCHDSRGLAHHFEDPELADILADNYVTRFVDVGWRNQNLDVIRRFGVGAIYATPTVFVIDAETETLLNRQERTDWGTAASRPIEDVRQWFTYWADGLADDGGVVETSLIYQSMLIEIELFEEAEAARLSRAQTDVARWRDGPRGDRPDDFSDLEAEAETWRRSLPRNIARLRTDARDTVAIALSNLADGAPISSDTVAALDAADPDLSLTFEHHESEIW
jgi:hypothetical protein